MKPRLVDLMCGAGGATRGYQLAGFHVTGVDIEPQPRYCGDEFVQADALTFPLDGFQAIHASVPCQHYANVTGWRGDRARHPDLIHAMRARLHRAGVPWVMENVPEAPLRRDMLLCGSMFGLNVRRHRIFELSWPAFQLLPPCHHHRLLPFMHKGERAYADAMGCRWMTAVEAREAIPPVFATFIGGLLLAHLSRAGAHRAVSPGPPTSSSARREGAPGGATDAPALDAQSRVHTPEPRDEHGVRPASSAGTTLLNTGTALGLEAAPTRTHWRPAFVDNDARPVPTTHETVPVKAGVL